MVVGVMQIPSSTLPFTNGEEQQKEEMVCSSWSGKTSMFYGTGCAVKGNKGKEQEHTVHCLAFAI